jgi:mannosyltransferase
VSSDARFDAARRRLPLVLLLCVLALAAAVRLHQIDAQSLWLDEAYTYARAAMAPAQSIAASIEKSHVPTYFLFMHYWLLLGDDELMLRLPSLIFGVLTVLAAFVLGRVAAGLRVGLVTALLVALAPYQVLYGQEARMYTMLTFAATVAMAGLVWLLRQSEQACEPLWHRSTWRTGQTVRWAWLAYVGGTVLTLYLHNAAVFFAATCGLCGGVLLVACRGRRLRWLANWAIANLAVLAVWSLWAPTLLVQTGKVARRFWPDPPTTKQIVRTLAEIYTLSDRRLWVMALFGALCVLGWFALRKQPRLAAGLALLAFVAPVLVLLVSLAKPMFLTRIMMWAAMPFFVLVACGVFALPWRLAPAVWLAALLALAGVNLERYYADQDKPPWKQIARELHALYRPGALILTPGSQERTSLSYYWNRRTDPIPAVPTSSAGRRVERQIRDHHTVWLLDYKGGQRRGTVRAIPRLEKRADLTLTRHFGPVVLLRYTVRGKPQRGN